MSYVSFEGFKFIPYLHKILNAGTQFVFSDRSQKFALKLEKCHWREFQALDYLTRLLGLCHKDSLLSFVTPISEENRALEEKIDHFFSNDA